MYILIAGIAVMILMIVSKTARWIVGLPALALLLVISFVMTFGKYEGDEGYIPTTPASERTVFPDMK